MLTEPCHVIRAEEMYEGKQRTRFFAGIAAGTVGAQRICMHRVTIPAGARGEIHVHEQHESALYILSGRSLTLYGDELQFEAVAVAGDFLYIPAGMPHCSVNLQDFEPVEGVLARTDPNEQESVVLRPDLERFLPWT
jgi:uncharacterized RmlC-like cupin family protein